MGLFVFLFSNLYGNRFGAAFAAKVTNPERDNLYFCQLMRQAGTIAVMCPTMSMVASILFNVILARQPVTQLPAIWAGTVIKNFTLAGEGKTTRKMNIYKCKSGHSANRFRSAFAP